MSAVGFEALSQVLRGQVKRDGCGVVEAVVPGQQVRVGDDAARATLVAPRSINILEGNLNVVRVGPIRPEATLPV